ncbi:hypothetical protein [Paraburkholderia sp. BCC1885]|uniref:hypothetical protein n=1 Tax=Paraburkholderia sp. BCC1885 TaxID=2562669 RepID=UPI00118368DA|nr:hypothetical protein [Paraburkholderia sp. BCC1885]
MIRIRPALLLAVTATGTAVSMSVLAGWQRGGWLAERLVWMSIGVVLVAGAHLLPALCRSAPLAVRGIGGALWLGCMAAASYGHATFFLLSQSHAGEVRVAAMPVSHIPAHRSLTAVMTDRAAVTAELAVADARRCVRDCPALRVRRVSLAAKLDTLDAEAVEVRRLQAIEDGNAGRRDAIRDDPVTARLAIILGVADTRLDLFAGLAFAAVLEGVACLLWWIALVPGREPTPVTAADLTSIPAVTSDLPAPSPTVTKPDTEIAKLQRDIEAGIVKPTVVGIRRHLRCSQARAAALRRQLASLTA